MGNDGIESSRNGSRRLKKIHLASVAISQQQGNECIRICERGSNPSAERVYTEVPNEYTCEEQLIEEQEALGKKKRGPTRLRELCSNPTELIEVDFNERGQPIGEHSEWLSSFLGALARQFVPVNIDDWRKVPNETKKDLWTCVKGRFKIDDMHEKLIIQQMGTRWRQSKSKLIESLRDVSKMRDKESKFAALKPDNISLEEWSTFIAEKLSNEFEVKSKMYKEIRANNHAPHTMSRKGYARLEDEMRKENPEKPLRREDIWCKAHTKKNGEVPTPFIADCMSKIQEITSSQTSHLTSINEDALSQILGPERNGRVRGMGFGITPSKMGIHMNSSKKVQALENQVSELNKKMEKFEHLENEMAEMRHFMRMQGFASKEKANSKMASPHLHNIGSRENLNGKSPTPSSHNGSSNARDCYGSTSRDARTSVTVDRKCKLLDWRKKVLAEATIASTDPNAMVHGVPVGNDAWKVWVQVALVPNADLWRPNSDMPVIADAVGSTTAWPKLEFGLTGMGW